MLSCPSSEQILEAVTISNELSHWRRFSFKMHIWKCKQCAASAKAIEQKWQSCFSEVPDITSSLLNVFSRLQNDETLILKGWKFDNLSLSKKPTASLWDGWLLRGAASLALGAFAGVVIVQQVSDSKYLGFKTAAAKPKVPLAQIRLENKNSVKVQYLEPELLQTIEFETTRSR